MIDLGILNFNQQMRERTLSMSVHVHDLLQHKKITQLNRSMVQQLLRSSSSVAANWRAAARARSDAEFYSKVCIVAEECDETQFWFEYLGRISVVTDSEIKILASEIDQLVKIFTSIKKKLKIKITNKLK
ncbi:MAG: four helix bundle protein [Bacteroidales bacterium]|jgi:four helix bundle protein